MLAFTLAVNGLLGQKTQLELAYHAGGVSEEGLMDLAADAEGNTYLTGFFSRTVDFDQGPGLGILSTPAIQFASNAFIIKLESSGNYRWGVQIGGSDDENQVGTAISVDDQGNVYALGNSSGNLQLPNGNSYTAAPTQTLGYALKLDSAGNTQWAWAWGNDTSKVQIRDIQPVGNASVFLTGEFFGVVDFDPGPATAIQNSGGGLDIFILELDATGNYLQSTSRGGSGNDFAMSLAGFRNQIWVMGSYDGTANFGGSGQSGFTLTSHGASDCYLMRLDSNLSTTRVLRFGGSGFDVAWKLLNWKNTSLYALSQVSGAGGDLDPNPAKVIPFNSSFQRPCIQKLDSLGNAVWARTIESTNLVTPAGIAITDSGSVAVAGQFISTLDVDPNPFSSHILTAPAGERAGFFLKLSAEGDFNDAIQLDSDPRTSRERMAVSAIDTRPGSSNIHLGGNFSGTFDVDPSAVINPVQSSGQGDIFHLVFSDCRESFRVITDTACVDYVLPSGDTVFISGTYYDTLTAVTGCDSAYKLYLTIYAYPDTNLTLSGGVLYASPGVYTYQWIDCLTGLPIAGADSSSFRPPAFGSYAVIMDNGECLDTTPCFGYNQSSTVGFEASAFAVYPNPADDELNVLSPFHDFEMTIYDQRGQQIRRLRDTNEPVRISDIPNGLYIVELRYPEFTRLFKLLINHQ